MKNLYLSCFLLLHSCFSFAQNLVPNPSFEEYDTCPNSYSQIHFATGWWSANESPDYYNICATGISPLPAVPTNGFGYQFPANGVAYAGYFNYVANSGREYLGVELLENIKSGKKYSIGFMINRSDGLNGGRVISNNMGMWFSNILFNSTNPKLPNNFSHFKVDTLITDTANWISISGVFNADSNYRYLYIGNFYDNEHTDSIETTLTTNNRSYYYVDDIFVIEDTTTSQNELNNNKINSYLDYNNYLIIEHAKGNNVKVIDIDGNTVLDNESIGSDTYISDLFFPPIIIVIITTISSVIYIRKHINPKN